QHRQHFLVGDLERVVDRGAFEVAGDAALADALADRAAFGLELAGLDPAVDRRALRIGRCDHDAGVLLLQVLADARERAAGADGAREAVDPAARLRPDLRARALHVAFAV